MNRGNTTGGIAKCRKFTRLVNILQATPVISTTLTGLRCLFRLPDAADFTDRTPASAACIARFSKIAGLAAWVLLCCHVGAAHAQRHHPAHRTARTQHAAASGKVIETGAASYYGKAHQGRRTASGQRFDEHDMTAAHPWLPFGTKVRVTLLSTGRSVVVEITDRLHSTRRIVDLSLGAARALGMVRQGVAVVALSPG